MKKFNRLYIIDDDKIYHFLLKNLLKQNGIDTECTFFCDGEDAIKHLKENKDNGGQPDLILLDVNMPVMNGWQFLEEYSKIMDSLPVKPIIYMISSSNDEVDINKAKGFGAMVKDYFLKPICKEDLDKIFLNTRDTEN